MKGISADVKIGKEIKVKTATPIIKNNIKKRNSRALPLLDYDDLLFLSVLDSGNYIEKNALHYDALKEKLNMSHNAFLTHQRRLTAYELVNISQLLDDKERFSGKKLKYIYITDKGIDFFKYLMSFKVIKEGLDGYNAALAIINIFD